MQSFKSYLNSYQEKNVKPKVPTHIPVRTTQSLAPGPFARKPTYRPEIPV